jgi:hypothetical protein
MTIYDAVGTFGSGLIIIAYLLLQLERIRSTSLSYSFFNALGAALILFSLIYSFNLPALVIEAFWLLISLFGIYRANQHRARTTH